MIFYTGDIHGSKKEVVDFCQRYLEAEQSDDCGNGWWRSRFGHACRMDGTF